MQLLNVIRSVSAILLLLVVAIFLAPPSGAASQSDDVAAQVRALTDGARVRIVWVQDAGEKSDPFAERDTLHLMGFDSLDGKGVRRILPAIGSYDKPLITDEGGRVVFGNVVDKKVYVVNWDGTGLRALVDNAALADVWTDPQTNIAWVYAHVTERRGDKDVSAIRRFDIDDPAVSEMVWDKMPVSDFQVSADGKAAAGHAGNGDGLLTLPNGTYRQFYGGCWPSMAPDDSHRVWVFRGHHKGVFVYDHDEKTNRRTEHPIEFLNAPDVPSSNELYHPRWGNHTLFFTITGSYWYKDWKWLDDIKLSNEAAAKVELYLGKFNADLDRVEEWVKITNNDRGDFFGDVWVDLNAYPEPTYTPQAQTGQSDAIPEWPGNRTGLAFIWENKIATNEVIDADTAEIHLCPVEPRDLAL